MALKPMSGIEKAYWALKDLEKKLKLITDEVAAQIPARTTAKPKGWIIDPENGKKIWYDKRLKQEYDKRKKAKEKAR